MFRVTINDRKTFSTFKNSINALTKLRSHAVFVFDSEKMFTAITDDANVCLANLCFDKNFFIGSGGVYDLYEKNHFVINFDLFLFFLLLNNHMFDAQNNNDIFLQMTYNEKKNRDILLISNGGASQSYSLIMPPIDANIIVDVPSITLCDKMYIHSSIISKIIHTLNTIEYEQVSINAEKKNDKDQLTFHAQNDYGSACIKINSDRFRFFLVNDNVMTYHANFSVAYLHTIMQKTANLSDNVWMFLENNYPLVIVWELMNEKSFLKYMLSPISTEMAE